MLKTASIIVMVLFATSLSLLEYYGRHSSVYLPKPTVITVSDVQDIYWKWKQLGIRGRTGLYFSRHLNFVNDPADEFVRTNRGFPIEARPASMNYEGMLSEKNMLWVSAKANILRQIHNIVPQATFPERAAVAKENPLYVLDRGIISIFHEIVPRTITTSSGLPKTREPVLIAFHPSFFDSGESPDEIFRLFQGGKIRADVIIFCIPAEYEDKEAITKSERLRLLIEHSM
jgi:hypothetical protein